MRQLYFEFQDKFTLGLIFKQFGPIKDPLKKKKKKIERKKFLLEIGHEGYINFSDKMHHKQVV